MLRTSIDLMKENESMLTKAWIRRYPAQAITDTDYAYDMELLENTPVQVESLLIRLE